MRAEVMDRRGFGTLREDAARLLADAPDGLEAGVLAQALFGVASGDRWVSLLTTVLGNDDRVRHDGDRWLLMLPRRPSFQPSSVSDPMAHRVTTTTPSNTLLTAPPKDDQGIVMALALQTTGADPFRHRIARIAVVRREHDEVTARFDVELGGEWRIGRRGLADDSQLDEDAAPTFAEIVPALRELLDGHAVHAYGSRRAAAFLHAELRRTDDESELNVRFLELDDCLREMLPGSRKPGLVAAAEELGIPGIVRGTPLAEADLVARIVERVRQRQAASPGRASLGHATDDADATAPLPFTRAWLADVPEASGVYVLADATGQTLYVGKAVNLRRRLADYVATQPSLHRRFEALGVRTTTVQTVVTSSDLEATLLEARLIREHQPTFNTARATRGPVTTVRAAPDDSTPRVHLVAEARSDGARYFGPFESARAARLATDVARAAYPAAFERRRGDVDAQRRAVLAVCQLLSGQKEATVGLLRDGMRDAAGAGDQPEVDRLRAALRGVQALEIRPSFMLGLPAGWRMLVLEWLGEHAPRRLHLIQDGRLLASADTDATTLPSRPALRTKFAEGAFGPPDAVALDSTGDTASSMPADTAPRTPAAPAPWTPADPVTWTSADTAIVLRWLVQARQRIEMARLPTVTPDLDADRTFTTDPDE